MGILKSVYRYITTLGGLLEGSIDSKSDNLLSSTSGIKATYQQTREKWTKQYGEIREAIAQLMMVLEQKKKLVESLSREAKDIKIKQKGAVEQYKKTNEGKYQNAFNDLFNRDKEIATQQEQLNGEIKDLHNKVEDYKAKLNDMQSRIHDLKKQEAEAIADIVSSKQIIKLNDRLNSLSTDLDDRNLQAIDDRRQSLKAQSNLSGELAQVEATESLEKELLNAGMQSEAADVFAAMLNEESKAGGTGAGAMEKEKPGRELWGSPTFIKKVIICPQNLNLYG